MANFMSNAELDGKHNVKKLLSELDKKKKEDLAIKTLSSISPLITFEIDEFREKNDERFYVRGSFVHSNGQELAALSELRYDFDDEMIKTLSEDIATGYELDRKRKEAMSDYELRKRQIKS